MNRLLLLLLTFFVWLPGAYASLPTSGIQNLSQFSPGPAPTLDGPGGFFRLSNVYGKLMIADDVGAGINELSTLPAGPGYFEVKAQGGLGSFKLAGINFGELSGDTEAKKISETQFYDVYIEGFLNDVSQGVTALVDGRDGYFPTFPLVLGSLATKQIDSFRIWFKGDGATISALNFISFTIADAAAPSAAPVITSATYDAFTGSLSVNGTDFAANGSGADVDVSKLTLTGEGGSTYTLTTAGVEIMGATAFSVTLNAADKAAVNQIYNKNGTASTGGTTYNLAAASNWMTNVSGAADLTGNGITVSNVAVPAITSAAYDATTGQLVVTGTGFLQRGGAANDIAVSKLTLTGEGGSSYTLTSGNVEISSGTSFTVALNVADKNALSTIFNKNGNSSSGGSTYNLAAAEDWAAGADPAVVVADLSGNGVTVSNVPLSSVSSIIRASASPTNAATVNYTVTFATAVTGVTADDFTLTKTGTAKGTIGTPTGSGTTWTVPVASVSGDGNLRLDFSNLTGVTPNVSAAHTSGEVYTIDNTAPSAPSTPDLASASDTGPSTTDNVTNDNTPTLTGTAEAGSTVRLYGSDGITVLGSATAVGGAWSITTSPLAAGTYSLTARATDAAGNESGASMTSLSVTIDTAAPTLAITSNVSSLKAGETATITFTFSEDPGTTFTAADLVLSGGTLSGLSGTGTVYMATFTPNAATTGTAGISVAGGAYTDVAGNAGGGASLSIVFDTEVPSAPSGLALAPGSDSGVSATDHVTNVTTPTFRGTAEAWSTVALYDTEGNVLGTAITAGDNSWSMISSPLPAGTHSITARATDAAGNTSAVSTSFSLTIDTSAPTLTVTSSVSSVKAGETATITFTFSEDPGATFAAGDVVISGGVLSALSGSGNVRTAVFTPTTDFTGTASITVAGGDYTDVAGNSGGGASSAFTIDTQVPTAPSTPDLAAASDNGPSDTDNVTNDTTPTFTGTAEEGSTVTLFNGAAVIGSAIATGGAWSITTSALSSGTHMITATATDAAGNTGVASGSLTVTIDATAPTLTITSDKSTLKVGETATITFTFSEDPGSTFIAADIVVSGGTLSGLSSTGSVRTATFTPAANENGGTASISVAVSLYTDLAGNLGGAGTTPAISYDTKAPAAPASLDLADASDSGASQTDHLTFITTPTFTGTAEDGATVKLYDGATLVGSAIATGGNWSITTSALNEGTHSLAATATDAAGNTGAASAGIVVTIDITAPPAPVVINPAEGSTVTTATPVISGTADPNTTVKVYIDGSLVSSSVAVDASGNWTYTPAPLTNGSRMLGAMATDLAGNTSAMGGSIGFFVNTDPTISATGTLTSRTTTYGTASASQNFNVSAVNLTAGIVVTAPAGFEVSADNTTFSSTVTVGAAGHVSATPVYVRLKSGLGVGNYSGNISLTSAGATMVDVATHATNTVGKAVLAVSATGQNEEYNGTDAATVTLTDNRLSGDVLTLAYTSATFNNKNVGTGKPVSVSGITVTGTDAGNYTFNTTASASGAITAKALTVSATGINREYNGSTAATVSLADDRVSGDVLTLAYTTASFDNKQAGAGKPVSVSGITVIGADAGNYTFNTTATASASITAKALTVTATGRDKPYNGDNEAVVVLSDDRLAGDVLTLAYGSATFDNKSVGNNKPVAVNGIAVTGADAANYTVNTSATTSASITAKALTVTATGQNKQYNGDNVATVALADDRISGDVLTLAYTSASFNNKQVGTGKPVSVSSITVTGADAANYSFNTTATASASITAKALTVTATGQNKQYNGDDVATAVLSDDRVSGDLLTLSYADAAFDDKNAGVDKQVLVNGITVTGIDAGNYTFNITATTAAAITPKPITVTADAGLSKVYGSADPAFTYQVTSSSLVGSDVLAGKLSRATGENVNTYAIGQGTLDAGTNYTLTYVGSNFAITPKPVTVTADADQSKTYGSTEPVLKYSLSHGALIGSDKFGGNLSRTVGEGAGSYTINQGSLSLSSNYLLSFIPSTFTINQAGLTITADNKQKFVGTANPAFTVSYAGFVNGEEHTVLTTLPVLSTTATTSSPLGDYPITVSGAAATNYEMTYVNGTLKVVPGAPTSVALAGVTLYENRPIGTAAGTLSSTSDDPAATFTYTLVSGNGDTDNASFKIEGDKLQTAASLNFEAKSSYSIRVRSTTQHSFSLDQVFTIALSDVNEIPTLAAIGNQVICYTTAVQNIALTGISAGPESSQSVVLSLSSSNPDLFDQLTVTNDGRLSYKIRMGMSGTATITVTVKDNGGTANGGTDTFSRNLTITVNPLPVIAITSDKGTNISKGDTFSLTATGGSTYLWENADGILGGQSSATLRVRPTATATYRVRVTTAAGCISEQEIRIEVKDDYHMVKGTNILSPNGDGVNDNFIIKNIDMYPNNTVKIFDRGGRLLYSKVNYKDEWNGTFQGSPLAEGTYYYVVDFGTGKVVLKGFITIVRD